MLSAGNPRRQACAWAASVVFLLTTGGAVAAERLPAPLAKQIAQSDPAADEAVEPPVSSMPDSITASFADWLLRCQRSPDPKVTARVCDVVTFVVAQGQSQPFAQITLTQSPDRVFHVTALVPVNITIGITPTIATDEADPGHAMPWVACTPSGCIADVALTDADLQRFRAYTKQGRLTFSDSVGNQVRVAFSFRGLAQALDAMALETISR